MTQSGDTSDANPPAPAPITARPADEGPAFAPDFVPPHLRTAQSGPPRGPLITLAVAWSVGIALAALAPFTWLWLMACILSATGAACGLVTRRARFQRRCALTAVIAIAGTWSLVHGGFVASDHLAHFVTPQAQLAQVAGTIESPAVVKPTQRGPFAAFSYEPPSTSFIVNVNTITIEGVPRPTRGRLLARLRQADPRLREGDEVAITGWMQAIDEPSNPGEFDYRAMYAQRDIDARISMNVRGNCKVTRQASAMSGLDAARARVADRCAESLKLGLAPDPQRQAFLDTILLGRWSRDLDALSESFRRTGLTHILSISGAHLTILMLLVWMAARQLVHRPSRAAMVVLAVLALYMMAVPWRVPIVRAGLMAAMVCIGAASGRKVRAIDMIALTAVLVLLWRPADLFNAGAQLSFGVVAGLLAFTRPVGQWMWPDPAVIAQADAMRAKAARWCADFVAANFVAFVIATPLCAYHFGFVSPLSMLLSLLSLPAVTGVLALGYLKILVGLVAPSAGMILAGPLEWVSDSMTGLVEHASHWPASTIMLSGSPSAAWLVATLAVSCAALAGWTARRPIVMTLAITLCAAWLIVPHHPRVAAAVESIAARPAMRVNMFAVGDGSCFLIRLAGSGEAPAHVLMFDCGSQGFLEVGARSIVPAMRSLRVSRIDTLIVSHADLDHFSGVLDLVEDIPVARVLVPPQLLAEAERDAQSAAAHLIDGLREQRIDIAAIARGWSETLGGARADILWPPADFSPKAANSASLVLSLRVGTRRMLLSGDIDQAGIPLLLRTGDDLRCDIADLPHHGSFVAASPQWFAAVKPTFVLQSSGPARLRTDKWMQMLSDPAITRLITAQLGMVELDVESGGTIRWRSHRKEPAAEEP
jgi:competence protein ComEC